MMVKVVCLLFLASFVFLETTEGFGSGAPGNTCWSMRPRHYPNSPQLLSSSPFRIIAPGYYAPGVEYEVFINSTGRIRFRGFLLEARDRNDDTVGTFRVSDSGTQLRCSSGAMTHTSPQSRRNVKGFWRAPSSDVGPIVFRATVVQTYSTFWVGISSSQVLKGPTLD